MNLPVEKKTRYLVTLPNVSDAVAARALVNYHLGLQRPMMGDFLDALGVAHEEGLIKDETVVKPESEKLRAAVAHIGGKYPADDVALYLSTLVSQDPDTWGSSPNCRRRALEASTTNFQFPTPRHSQLPTPKLPEFRRPSAIWHLGVGSACWKLEVGRLT